ncbi:tyrosine recombinase XerD [Dictyobacter vulcani]|uniref:Tyrosine recombinase XerD n=1 Tax=Dictyobacter vulcani TaxID=2607529 RepID=A0A5J4KFE4_9CHLR|nr:tyrosine-type recombinase/integrase [Dictyobacter vulcani]GER86323.1 tyrosine recombinase XerD [Dictyobacter vulcani]
MAIRNKNHGHMPQQTQLASLHHSQHTPSGKEIRSAIDDFLLDRQSQNHSQQTMRWHTIALEHVATFLEDQLQIVVLHEIEAVHIRAWLVFLEKEVGPRGKIRAARTRRWYAQSVHAFCHWLYEERYIEEDPMTRVKLPKIEKPLIRIIEFEEFERLLTACSPVQEKGFIADRNTARNQAILWLLWDTGIRLRELCGLRLPNFDRRQGTIIVFGKGRKERRIAIGKMALRILLYYIDHWRPDDKELEAYGNAGEDHLFLAENGQALTIHGIQMLFKRLRKRANFTDRRITPHIFRHTFAVRYLMLGGDIFSLQEMLGHEDISTVKNYMHLNDVNVQTQKRKFSPGDHMPTKLPGPKETFRRKIHPKSRDYSKRDEREH